MSHEKSHQTTKCRPHRPWRQEATVRSRRISTQLALDHQVRLPGAMYLRLTAHPVNVLGIHQVGRYRVLGAMLQDR